MSDMKKNAQKGIHQPDYSTTYYKDGKIQDGISRAGIKTREATNPSSFEEYEESPKIARSIHERVLGEMKQMPKPNLPSVRKDDMPHEAGSPEDSAHDVAEEGSSLQDELSDLTPEEQAEMLAHLRMLKDKRELRSPENQAVGADENAMAPDHNDDMAPEMDKSVHGVFGKNRDPHERGVASVVSQSMHGYGGDAKEKSLAGIAVRRGDNNLAREAHKETLSEVRSMPKPNLPKSEDGMGKSEYSPREVALEVLKKAESLYKSKAELWDNQKIDKRIQDLPVAQTREVLNENDIANAVSQKLTDTSVQRLKSYLESRKAKKGVK